MVVGRDSRMVARRVQYGRALVDWASRGTRTRTRTVVYKAGRRITSPSSLHTCNPAPEIYTWSNAAYECRATPKPLHPVYWYSTHSELQLLPYPSEHHPNRYTSFNEFLHAPHKVSSTSIHCVQSYCVSISDVQISARGKVRHTHHIVG